MPFLPSRRDWLRLGAAGMVGPSASGWLGRLANAAAGDPQRKRSCILLWMTGGPSQMDTFDLKSGHNNGGPFKPIDTTAPGVRICEHLPQLAKQMKHLAVVRSMWTKEGDHSRGAHLLHTGYVPRAPVEYPSIGSLVSHELGDPASELPSFVSVDSRRFCGAGAGFGAGFLGAQNAPLVVGKGEDQETIGTTGYEKALHVGDLRRADDVTDDHAAARLDLLQAMSREFTSVHPDAAGQSVQAAYDRAFRLMHGSAARAFNLDEEPAALRDAYGRNLFGQGCLLARRLVERSVPFVEVALGYNVMGPLGWDTHIGNFDAVKQLSGILDPAWATLIADLADRGLLETTTLIWMGEFGRTPKINPQQGRDHFAAAWSAVLGGGGIKGGQAFGKTSADGMEVEDRQVTAPDLLATLCKALGVDPLKTNRSNIGRPIRIVDKSAQPIDEVLA